MICRIKTKRVLSLSVFAVLIQSREYCNQIKDLPAKKRMLSGFREGRGKGLVRKLFNSVPNLLGGFIIFESSMNFAY